MDVAALDDWALALISLSCGSGVSFDEVGAADSDLELDEIVPMEVDESPLYLANDLATDVIMDDVDPDSLSTTQARYVWERPLQDLGGEDFDMVEELRLNKTKDSATMDVAKTKHRVHWWDGLKNKEDSAEEEKDAGFGIESAPQEFLEDLKIELRALLERTGDEQHRKAIMEELWKRAEADKSGKSVKDLVLLIYEMVSLTSAFRLDDPNTFASNIHKMLKIGLNMYEDLEAEKPQGWLDDEPEEIGDPESTKPDDWDDDEDGELKAPKISNPKCEEKRLTELKLADVRPHFRTGNTFYALGRYSDAKELYILALEAAETSGSQWFYLLPQIHVNLGISLESEGMLLSACEHYRESAILRLTHYRALKHLGSALFGVGEYKAAEKALEEAIYLSWLDVSLINVGTDFELGKRKSRGSDSEDNSNYQKYTSHKGAMYSFFGLDLQGTAGGRLSSGSKEGLIVSDRQRIKGEHDVSLVDLVGILVGIGQPMDCYLVQ